MRGQLPWAENGLGRFDTRHEAIEKLDPPSLWENRTCYRITQVETGTDTMTLHVGKTHFFNGLDVSESLAIEMLRSDRLQWHKRFRLRHALGDPHDLWRNPIHAGVATLTIVRGADGIDRFYLHERDQSAVADGVGHVHVIPAGVFQPSSEAPAAWTADQDVWKNIIREACEEFLPDDEVNGASAVIDYETVSPYSSLVRCARAGDVRCFFFGVGIDALQLQPEILTACVYTERAFRMLFGATFAKAHARNKEGLIVGAQVVGTTKSGRELIGFTFNESVVKETLSKMPLVSGAAACLYLSWAARDTLFPAH
jgi:hypothetical protein